ncbi:hypothetical protein ACR77J_07070 [Tissierella praeacuta]
MNKEQMLQNAIKLQNQFILELFNDTRISDDVKEEYAVKYNELLIKAKI